jgi:hypothetical protein
MPGSAATWIGSPLVESSAEPFERRALAWDLSSLPVPAEILIYPRDEWQRMDREGGRFARMLRREAPLARRARAGPDRRELVPCLYSQGLIGQAS